MILTREQYAERLYLEFEDELFKTAMRALDRHAASKPEKFAAATEMGKVLVVLGCNFLGNACLMGSEESLAKAKEVLAFFRKHAGEMLGTRGVQQ